MVMDLNCVRGPPDTSLQKQRDKNEDDLDINMNVEKGELRMWRATDFSVGISLAVLITYNSSPT